MFTISIILFYEFIYQKNIKEQNNYLNFLCIKNFLKIIIACKIIFIFLIKLHTLYFSIPKLNSIKCYQNRFQLKNNLFPPKLLNNFFNKFILKLF